MVKKPELDDDDAIFMPDLEENRRAPAFPFEDGRAVWRSRIPKRLGGRLGVTSARMNASSSVTVVDSGYD